MKSKQIYFDDLIQQTNGVEIAWSLIMRSPLPTYVLKIPLLRKDRQRINCLLGLKGGNEGKVVVTIQPHTTETSKVSAALRVRNQKKRKQQEFEQESPKSANLEGDWEVGSTELTTELNTPPETGEVSA
mmetsp:Transcript_5829/g.8817  ORF Transcript_5829/g.8817 Transcript_5829/m.8817 type:complete len:129 (-) Transcript_5829:72-458(-)